MQVSFTDKMLAKFVPHLAPPAAAPPVPVAAAPAGIVASAASAATTPTVAAPVSQPVEDASFAAQLFSKVGGSQEKFLANQQMLGQVTSLLGARISQIGSNALRLLRGEEPSAING